MANLTQEKIDSLVEKLNYYKYLAQAGDTELGPLESAPKIEADVETKDTTLYETGDEAQASILSKNNIKVTFETRNVDAAMSLLSQFKKGDNVLLSNKAVSLTLVPITADTGAKSISFSRAFLQPGLSTSLSEGDDKPTSVTLTYICKPDAETGKPFTYGTEGVGA